MRHQYFLCSLHYLKNIYFIILISPTPPCVHVGTHMCTLVHVNETPTQIGGGHQIQIRS